MVVVKPTEKINYYMDPRLKRNIDNSVLPGLHQKDKDYVFVVDGAEGSGKSWFAFQIGKYIDNDMDLSQICFTGKDFHKAVLNANKGEVIIYDEAFGGLGSRGALSKINRMLVELMMQMRQKNLCVIIVLPTFYLLDRYVAIFRAKALFHIYESGGRRGYFRVFNQKLKKLLYLNGKKNFDYSWPRTDFSGRFYGKFALGNDKEEAYRKKKAQALKKLKEERNQEGKPSKTMKRYKNHRDAALSNWYALYKKHNPDSTQKEFINHIEKAKIEMTRPNFTRILGKTRKKGLIVSGKGK